LIDRLIDRSIDPSIHPSTHQPINQSNTVIRCSEWNEPARQWNDTMYDGATCASKCICELWHRRSHHCHNHIIRLCQHQATQQLV